jgi:hypothetical protein
MDGLGNPKVNTMNSVVGIKIYSGINEVRLQHYCDRSLCFKCIVQVNKKVDRPLSLSIMADTYLIYWAANTVVV